MSEQGPPPDAEARIRASLTAGDTDGALAHALQAYGPELLGFLHAQLKDVDHARDAFTWLAEALWKGLPRFRGECSVRSWAFAIARNVAARYAVREVRKQRQAIPLSEMSRQSALAVVMPMSTSLDVRAERLRAQLTESERTLLTLRVDKGMDWNEIALVMLYEGELEEPSAELRARESVRLRKRFQLLKDKLRKLAAEAD